jgi:diaminopimelate epimerase
MGNPHVTFYCRDVARVPLESNGPRIETHAIFPRRINVHFVEVVDAGRVKMRTWERGSGITLACGSGACAAAVAVRALNNVDFPTFGRPTLPHLHPINFLSLKKFLFLSS